MTRRRWALAWCLVKMAIRFQVLILALMVGSSFGVFDREVTYTPPSQMTLCMDGGCPR